MEVVKQRTVKDEIPKGAVMLTRSEALLEQALLIQHWKPQSDVWSLMHGRGIMAITSSLIGIYINTRFRRKLKVHSVGKLSSMIALTAAPALLTSFFHTQIVFNKLLLLETSCPLCLELRGALIQSFFGGLIPIFLTPLINFAVIDNQVRNIPYVYEGRKILTVIRSIYQPMIPRLGLIFIFQVLFGGYMTHLQIKSYLRLLDIQYLIEQEKKKQEWS